MGVDGSDAGLEVARGHPGGPGEPEAPQSAAEGDLWQRGGCARVELTLQGRMHMHVRPRLR